MDYSFLNACVVGTMTTNIVNSSRGSFLEVISGSKETISNLHPTILIFSKNIEN